jgi:polysaccharide biosynthesis protein PelF
MSTDFHSRRSQRSPETAGTTPPRPDWPPVDTELPTVDVAIVAESTYPYLKGGVSAVVHDIIAGNPDLTFGIIHLTWDRSSAHKELYEVPSNVSWVRPIFLSMHEHRDAFMGARPSDLGMRPSARRHLARRLFAALHAVTEGDADPLWQLYDEGFNPRTRRYPLWALLGTRELMQVACEQLSLLELPLVDTFWLLREFFSLAYALLHDELPPASIYHAHTTGHASLVAAAAARQHGTNFLLTEHNLYVRDTINMLLDRHMALPVTVHDWREFDVKPIDRAWMAWWIELGRLCYPQARAVTYLYPSAITEAADLGTPIEKSVVIPNGVALEEFEESYAQRQDALPATAAPDHRWRLAYIARVVPCWSSGG